MSREVQVRFCEGLGVRFPRATRPVLYFQSLEDARRVLEALPKRLGKYGLTMHPDKTKLLDFRSPKRRKGEPGKSPFDFLGFTFYWGNSRKGEPIVRVKTARKKLTVKLNEIYQWCKENRHLRWDEQHSMLSAKLRGHIQYYGVSHNCDNVDTFIRRATRFWHKWLNRRGGKPVSWEKFARFLENHPLPKARIVHRLF